jgi:hypothetical protein
MGGWDQIYRRSRADQIARLDSIDVSPVVRTRGPSHGSDLPVADACSYNGGRGAPEVPCEALVAHLSDHGFFWQMRVTQGGIPC